MVLECGVDVLLQRGQALDVAFRFTGRNGSSSDLFSPAV